MWDDRQVQTIEHRFNGPPDLGHGGYSCAVGAVLVDAPVAAASLRRPVPLDTELREERDGDSVKLLDNDDVVIEAGPATLDLDPPPPVSLAEAEATTPLYPTDLHAFPTCFGCGPHRDPADSIRIMVGPVERREDVLADVWVPLEEFGDPVEGLWVWAALDCPTGWGAVPLNQPPHVLARLTADPAITPIRGGEPHVVTAWLIDAEGRKRRGGAAIWTADGVLCAKAEGLWIAPRDPGAHGATRT
ncbi:MAG: hypothetical protein H0V29_02895 [Thermoleophilaceae bacterium]|nr:hypothetical protein [Thermoleophilaceae bacterium]